MGTQLPRLALLLAVLQYAAVFVTGSAMSEILQNGGRRILKNRYYGTYLVRNEDPYSSKVAMEAGDAWWNGYWTIQKVDDTHVSIKAINGKYLGHHNPVDLNYQIGKWEKWTPVNNGDGSWSFKSDADSGWLSAHRWNKDKEVVGGDENKGIERWILTTWEGSYLDELTSNGGRQMLINVWFNNYLTGQEFIPYQTVETQNYPGVKTRWIIEKISEFEVSIKATNGYYLGHRSPVKLMKEIGKWERWAPEKNRDGTWSFKSQADDGWLSGRRGGSDGVVETGDENKGCEKWKLRTWTPSESVMVELLQNGGRRIFKSQYYKTNLVRNENPYSKEVAMETGDPGWTGYWTIEKLSERHVTIKASNGKYLGHRSPVALRDEIEEWEKWTPVKNSDGSWSFKSDHTTGWLSSHRWNEDKEIVTANDNSKCETWILENWNGSFIDELTADGGRRTLKSDCLSPSHYLTGQEHIARNLVRMKAGDPGNASHWIIQKKSEIEVTLQAANGLYLQHGREYELFLSKSVSSWNVWAPVKNKDGSWSFKSDWNPGWLSSNPKYAANWDGHLRTRDFNGGCEQWTLETWKRQSINEALMQFHVELLKNGGRFMLKAQDGKYLDGHNDLVGPIWTSETVSMVSGPPGDTNKWTIVQQNDKKVALRASNGWFLQSHRELANEVGDKGLWTPVKNEDRTWSFANDRMQGWLAAKMKGKYMEGETDITQLAKWTLVPW